MNDEKQFQLLMDRLAGPAPPKPLVETLRAADIAELLAELERTGPRDTRDTDELPVIALPTS